MKRILVVAYSGSGCTRQAAELIAKHCDADLEWIKDREARQGFMGYLRSAVQALAHREPWIQPPRHAPGDYALVIVGTPVWARNIASPVRSYLARYGARCRRVAFFCTHQGTGADKVLQDLQRLCGKRAASTLALSRGDMASGACAPALEQFARRFGGTRQDTETQTREAA